tara:strand:- start:2033 stop:2185 length:153 start_codon:yes stop_codon:yes gene_type:complete
MINDSLVIGLIASFFFALIFGALSAFLEPQIGKKPPEEDGKKGTTTTNEN